MNFLSAAEAAALLGITPATLYAYVSRGLIGSEPGPDARSRRYRHEDVMSLKQRREGRRNPARLVETALSWGSPVLESAICLISDEHIYYRGLDATQLALEASVEDVACLLWQGPNADFLGWPSPPSVLPPWGAELEGLAPLDRFSTMVPLAATRDLAALDLRPQGTLLAALRIVALLTWALCGHWPASDSGGLAAAVADSVAPGVPGARSLITSALILSADHELNVSTFAARCAASAGATPYAAVAAGLATVGGTRHGGQQQRVEALFDAVVTPDRALGALADWLRCGEAIPGFGHSLYPGGDPRGKALLALIERGWGGENVVLLAKAIADGTFELLHDHPNVDFALVTAARALGLSRGMSLGLFALGRSLGWLAHAMEQYADGRLIRPRARYVGPSPSALATRI